MLDHFEFLEALSVGTEVLTVQTGDRILKVVGVSPTKIILDNQQIFIRETGELDTKKKDTWNAIKQLTSSEKDRIEKEKKAKEEKEQKEQEERLITSTFNELVGNRYDSRRPTLEIQKAVIDLIQKMQAKK